MALFARAFARDLTAYADVAFVHTRGGDSAFLLQRQLAEHIPEILPQLAVQYLPTYLGMKARSWRQNVLCAGTPWSA